MRTNQPASLLKCTCIAILAAAVLSTTRSTAQTGNVSISFTPAAGKPINISFSKPLFRFDNANGYWFINPHDGKRHFSVQPDRNFGNTDAAFITFNEKENDFDVYAQFGNGLDELNFSNTAYVITAPDYVSREKDNNKPLHVHITTFTNSEIAFTISGVAQYTPRQGSAITPNTGTIKGSGHFYREPKFTQSDPLPGCDCDPTIYATTFDEENNQRTTSACENAIANKVFDAVQKSMAGLFNNVSYQGSGQIQSGEVKVTTLPQTADISGPPKDRPYCAVNFSSYKITGFNAHKYYYENEDGFGVRLIQMPDNATLDNGANNSKNMAKVMDSLMKLYTAKKITPEQFSKSIDNLSKNPAVLATADEFKRKEMELNLTVKVIINPSSKEIELLKLADKSRTAVQHNIKGAAFEIYSPQIKESDGSWLGNRMNVYFGKFTAPVPGKSGGGFDAELTQALYPANGNKLTIYNIIVRLDGGKPLMDKALANIDFGQLTSLITKQ